MSSASAQILLVEDNAKMAEAIRRGLLGHGFDVHVCTTGKEGEEAATVGQYDLIILDRMLPDRDGIDVCRSLRFREDNTPVILLTAMPESRQMFDGLDLESLMYLPKPFEFKTLIGCIEKMLSSTEPISSHRTVCLGSFILDFDSRTLEHSGESVGLSSHECKLLELLADKPNEDFTYEQISEQVLGRKYDPSSNVIEVVMNGLSSKLNRAEEPPLIHTVPGVGYRLCPPGSSSRR